MSEKELINYHPQPLFRGNYNIVLGAFPFRNIEFRYCSNNHDFYAFKEGMEIGVLTTEGKLVMLNYCNPENHLVIELKGQVKPD